MKKARPQGKKLPPGVVCFGEVLLALSTPGFQRFEQARQLDLTYTGAEANTALALVRLGNRSRVVTRVPEHALGQAAVNELRRYGVDTDFIVRGGPKLGLLFLETGLAQRPSKVLYDRKGSAFTELKAGVIDWKDALSGYQWFHFSGTSPAFGPGVEACLREGLETARRMGLGTSMDCNYRSTLWDLETARKAFLRLVPGLDLFSGTLHDLRNFFGGQGTEEQAASAFLKKYKVGQVALSQRQTDARGGEKFSGMLLGKGPVQRSRVHEVSAFGRIGSGDAFMAGILHGVLAGWAEDRIVEFAAAAACLKQTVAHDLALFSVGEIEEILRGSGGGVRR
jgi:2-dehydro-3-deoxygluconokinase